MHLISENIFSLSVLQREFFLLYYIYCYRLLVRLVAEISKNALKDSECPSGIWIGRQNHAHEALDFVSKGKIIFLPLQSELLPEALTQSYLIRRKYEINTSAYVTVCGDVYGRRFGMV